MVSKYLDLVERNKLKEIASKEKVSDVEVKQAIDVIKKLDPCPGKSSQGETATYIIPDVYLRKFKGEYCITLNEDGMPKLRVSNYYLNLLKQGGGPKGNTEYLEKKVKKQQCG